MSHYPLWTDIDPPAFVAYAAMCVLDRLGDTQPPWAWSLLLYRPQPAPIAPAFARDVRDLVAVALGGEHS